MTRESDAKFEEILTCGFQNDMRNLAITFTSRLESVKIEILLSKVENV